MSTPLLADDHQALIWDIQPMPQPIEVPILAYAAEGEINQVQWSSFQPDWIAICYKDNLEILRVWVKIFFFGHNNNISPSNNTQQFASVLYLKFSIMQRLLLFVLAALKICSTKLSTFYLILCLCNFDTCTSVHSDLLDCSVMIIKLMFSCHMTILIKQHNAVTTTSNPTTCNMYCVQDNELN